jgi:hypothetical protein
MAVGEALFSIANSERLTTEKERVKKVGPITLYYQHPNASFSQASIDHPHMIHRSMKCSL